MIVHDPADEYYVVILDDIALVTENPDYRDDHQVDVVDVVHPETVEGPREAGLVCQSV